MTDRGKNILIGLFIVGAIAIGVSMLLFLEPQIGDGKKTLRVRFANVAGIVVGTRVTFAGKPIGEVTHIREIENARNHPDETGRVYFYELTLKTDSSVEVYANDEIALRSTGLMGERSVAILPKASLNTKKITSEVIYANSTDPLENSFQQVAKVAAKLDALALHVDQWFQENSAPLSTAIQSFNHSLTHADQILSSVTQEELIPTLKISANLFNDNLESIKKSLTEDHLLSNLSSLVDQLDEGARLINREGPPLFDNLNQITQTVADGEGSVGRLIGKEDLYLHLNSVLSKAETMMNDINHYGVLFQYDKHWQRGRTRKANLLQALQTPKEFRSFFEEEVDAITASLGRLSELLDKAESSEQRKEIANDDTFKKQFASLLRNVQSLADSIKLYNESLQTQDRY
ncbi:MAG TPA: MlaD family protein [Chlamydiales bacterium]|nr:MAG: hypothetical protein A3F67_08365 [Verrucomicrobia bacterium RIFCSPHIGHO2_12_FULL_41_10]HLB53405.1 MlaD family protein [Chlamydiales bacterium]